MSGHYKTRSATKGNKTARGDTSATPDNPGNLRKHEERGHEAHATSYSRMTIQMLALLSSHRSMELGQNQSGSASSEWPGSGCTTPNNARMMQMAALLMLDGYWARNGPGTSEMSSNIPMTSNNARMVQTIAP